MPALRPALALLAWLAVAPAWLVVAAPAWLLAAPAWLLAAPAWLLAAPAWAQRPPALPNAGSGNEVPQGSPIPRIAPPVLPGAQPGMDAALAAPAPVAEAFHPVRAVSIQGATAYPPGVLDGLAAGLAGPSVPQSRIEAARTAIVNRYRADGYVFTAVSAFLGDGALRFVVTEGHVSEVQLEGDIGPAAAQVRRFLDHVTEARPIDTATIERWLLLASDVPGVTIRSVLRTAPGDPGALVLVAQVSRAAVSGLFTADNRGFPRAGPEQMLAVADLNSVTAFGERTELSLYHTFDGAQTFGQASSEAFLGGSGLKLRVYGGAGDTAPTGVFRAIGYDGFTTVFGAQLSYPVIRSRQQTLNVSAAFDALESEIRTGTGPGGAPARLNYDSIRVLRLGANYTRGDTLLGGGVNSALLRVSQGLPSFGASRGGAPDAPRLGEQTAFTKVDAEISRTQTLYHPWQDAELALVGTLAGQYSQDVLPPAEQYFLGGARFNRGYYSGQVTGDRALVGSLELQLTTALPVPSALPAFEASAQFYAFYDYGEAWQSHRADSNRTLNSAGAGGRFFLTKYVEFDLEGVARLTRYPTGGGANISAARGEALFWRVVTRF